MINREKETEKRKYVWVDTLKGIAICGVVMCHCNNSDLPQYLSNIVFYGKNCVQLFFVLSAFLLFISYEKHSATEKDGHWIAKKIIRLVPTYYIALAVSGILGGGMPYWLGSETQITTANVLAHILFLHGLFPHYINSIIGVEWYLGALVIFYVAVPFLYKKVNSIEKSVICFIGTGIGCCLINFLLRKFVPDVIDSYIYSDYLNIWFLAQLPVMILGILLFHCCKSQMLSKIRHRTLLSMTLFLFSLCMLSGMILDKNKLLGLSEVTLFGMWFFLIALSQYIKPIPFVNNIIFCKLGEYSYPIYLLHFQIISLYTKYIPGLVGNGVVGWLVKYVVVIATSFIIALPLHRWIEIPIERLMYTGFGFVIDRNRDSSKQ
ncbi:MAG: acyltransferase [Butyrivibrio sp.]|nr:acyltransferase [Butyrivibrio sp.]